MIVPGEPYRSMVLYRMAKLGYARMPHVGSQVVDTAAIPMIESWIRSLTPEPSIEHKPSSLVSESLSDALIHGDLAASERDNVLQEMLARTESALQLACLLHGEVLRNEEDARRAVALARQSPSGHVRGLFEAFVPEAERKERLGPSFDPQLVLRQSGDAERGKMIYLSDSARCRQCHPTAADGDALGPDLRESARNYNRRELLQHVSDPSSKVDPRYAQYLLVTVDGRTVTGLLESRTDEEVVLKTADKQMIRVANDEIEQLSKREQSLMPTLLLSDMTPHEAADLLEYLFSFSEVVELGQ